MAVALAKGVCGFGLDTCCLVNITGETYRLHVSKLIINALYENNVAYHTVEQITLPLSLICLENKLSLIGIEVRPTLLTRTLFLTFTLTCDLNFQSPRDVVTTHANANKNQSQRSVCSKDTVETKEQTGTTG